MPRDQNTRDTYFILLEYNLDAYESDWSKLEQWIKKKKSEWSNNSNHPQKGKRYDYLRDLVPDMLEYLQEDGNRKLAFDKAKRTKERELQDDIAIISTRAYYTDEDFKEICSRYPCFREETIRAEFVRHKCAPRTVPVPVDPNKNSTVKKTEKSTMDEIGVLLGIVEKEDLYDVLNLLNARSVSTAVLKQESVDLYNRANSQGTDARSSAFAQLGGKGMAVFATDETRKGYDAALAEWKAKEKLIPIFKLRISDKRVS